MEHRTFRMHPALLRSVIRYQSGTLAKAVLEAVMNSVDAGAKRVDLTVKGNHIRVSDDGRGFKDKEEVFQYFEIFGAPHEEGDAVFGRFRMGRGQLFNIGRNVWRSNGLKLTVDIGGDDGKMHQEGFHYTVEDDPTAGAGCIIDLDTYSPIDQGKYGENVESEVHVHVEYINIPVTINGKLISQGVQRTHWTLETPEAYFLFDARKGTYSGNLLLYNQGALVDSYGGCDFGLAGVVVSKKPLHINFARNQVLPSCPVWQSICDTLQESAEARALRKRKLTDEERWALARRLMSGEAHWNRHHNTALFKCSNGSCLSLNKISKIPNWPRHLRFTFARPGDPIGDKLQQQEIALVLEDRTMEQFGLQDSNPSDFFKKLLEKKSHPYVGTMEYETLEVLAKDINKRVYVVPRDKLTKKEVVLLSHLQWVYNIIHRAVYGEKDEKGEYTERRKVYIGSSYIAQAWTDGTSMVAVGRQAIKECGTTHVGFTKLALILLHEACHDAPDDAGGHDRDFYETYEKHSLAAIEAAFKAYPSFQKKSSREELAWSS